MSLGDTPAADQVAAQRELEQALDSLLARRVDPESALGRALDAQSSPVDALPSPELDSAIRAAARRAVSAGPRPTGEADIPAKPGRRWWGWGAAPMAAAAVIVLAVSVTTLVDREQQVAERIAAAQAPVVAAPAETVPQVADAARSSAKNAGGEAEGTSVPQRQAPAEATPPPPPPAPARAQAKADLNQNAAASAPPAVTAAASRPVERAAAVAESSLASDAARARTPEPFAAAADARANAGASAAPRAQSADALAAQGMRERADAQAVAPAAASSAAAPPAVRRAEAPGGGVREPDKWLEEIIALRRAGRAREADQALAEFRKAWPDYPLPSALRPAP